MNEINDFNFDFTEKSTRKAVIFGVIFGFISAIFAYNDAFGWINRIEIIGSIIYGVAVFIPCFFCGLIAFRSRNFWGFAVPPLALIISFYMPYQQYRGNYFKEVGGMVACYFGSILIVLMLSFFIGIILQWVNSGKE